MQKTLQLTRLLTLKELISDVSKTFEHPENNKFKFACIKNIRKIETMEKNMIQRLKNFGDESIRNYLIEKQKIDKTYFAIENKKVSISKIKEGELTKKIDQKKYEYEIKKLDKKYPDHKKKIDRGIMEEQKLLEKKMNINVHLVEEKNVPPKIPITKIELFYDFMVIEDKK